MHALVAAITSATWQAAYCTRVGASEVARQLQAFAAELALWLRERAPQLPSAEAERTAAAWAAWLAGATREAADRCASGSVFFPDLVVDPSQSVPLRLRRPVAVRRRGVGFPYIPGIGIPGVPLLGPGRGMGTPAGAAHDLLPLRNPAFCLRECCKDLALLEDHLIQPDRGCADCIGKHCLRAEAFAEEARTMGAGDVASAAARELREVWTALRAGTVAPEAAGQRIRDLRKRLYSLIPQGTGAAL